MEADDGPARFDRPARRLLSTPDALEVNPVLFEVKILFVPAYCADQPFYRTHKYPVI